MKVQSVLDRVKTEPAFTTQLQNDPVGTLNALADLPEPLQKDTLVYRLGVLGLVLVAVAGPVGSIVLAFYGKAVPEGAFTVSATAVGLLGMMLRGGRDSA